MDVFDSLPVSDLTKAFAKTKEHQHWDFLFEDEGPKPIPFKGPNGFIGDTKLVRWQITPMLFVQVLELMGDERDTAKLRVPRAAAQITGFDEHGIEYVLTPEVIRQQTLATGKVLVGATSLLGDVRPLRPPVVAEGTGNGIDKPLRFNLGLPVDGVRTLTFKATDLYELEIVASNGSGLYERAVDLMEVCDHPEVLNALCPADGWALLSKVLKPMAEEARKVLRAVRSYEYHMQMQFDRDLPLGVLRARMRDYADASNKKAAAIKAAQKNKPTGKPRPRRRR